MTFDTLTSVYSGLAIERVMDAEHELADELDELSEALALPLDSLSGVFKRDEADWSALRARIDTALERVEAARRRHRAEVDAALALIDAQAPAGEEA